ncbi:Imidazolonepropionase [Thermanaeromonas toyohensis ToBE]|uniref:Imidazolonepropionase n=1 Tax=Thermanaeromonas toyohensis ToBE TaxID=698762 RepID=A0A1W1VGC6_9FIRM|nr:amidohydrolase family protein [Thermanaeromonas toyohensis]SMB92366.1 Imidazolonepropionase [Thermanaeromonas toyohensis ToBE]
MKILRLDHQTNLDLLVDYLWDGESPVLHSQMALLIRRGQIEKIVHQSEYQPSGAQQFRLPNLTLLPGLIDAHVHLALDGQDFRTSLNRWPDARAMASVIKKELGLFLEYGITAIRDGSDGAGWNLEAKKWVEQAHYPGPRIVATGKAFRKKGYYGSFLGPGLTGQEDWKRLLNDMVEQGCEQVKIIVSGLITFRKWGEVGPLQFSTDELRYLVKEAHSLGLKVMAHANSDAAIVQALEAGVDSIEHGYFASKETLKRMADNGTFWVPTIAAVVNRLNTSKAEEYSPQEQDIIKRTYEDQLQKIAQAHELGVRLVVGTDAGAPGVYHGQSFLDELAFFRSAGLPTLAILKAATSTGAQVLGLEAELGTITRGKLPYFIAVPGNPLADLDILQKLEMVIYL